MKAPRMISGVINVVRRTTVTMTDRLTDANHSLLGRYRAQIGASRLRRVATTNDLFMSSVDQLMDVSYGVQCTAASPIGVLFRLQIGRKYGIEDHNRRHHHRSIADSG